MEIDTMLPSATMMPFAMVGIVAGIALASLIINYLIEKKRAEALRVLAGSIGLTFSAAVGGDLLSSLGDFQLFSQGRSRRVSNLMRGPTPDGELMIFDYRYTTGSGKSSYTWKQTVMLLKSDALAIPLFTLRPEGIFHKIGNVFGYDDIDFEIDPEFSDCYLLKGQDEAAVRRAFNGNVRTFFAQRAKLCAEGAGGQLIIYRVGKRADADGIRALRDDGLALSNLFRGRR
jgi:hypothetical protein